jgi:Holliday junction DNA helicase RuvA
MIGVVAGTLEELGPPVVVMTSGVGYEIWLPQRSQRRLPAQGSAVRFHTHLIQREDGVSLYGFSTVQERELFRMLIGVSGVGPKVALAVLGDEEAESALLAIRSGDISRLIRIKGVGRKTAERLVVELRDRALPAPLAAAAAVGEALDPDALAPAGPLEEAAMVLVSMGVPVDRAREAVAGAKGRVADGVEAVVRAALQRVVL